MSTLSRAFTSWVFAAILAITVIKGLRMPNRWSVTQYLFTYETGFTKRALSGEILFRVFGAWTAKYFFLAAVAFGLFAAFLALLIVACRRLPDTAERVPFLLALFGSPALSFSTHLAGYLEQVAYLALLVAVVLPRRWRVQIAIVAFEAALVPLVHEASVCWTAALSVLVIVAGPLARTQSVRARLAAATAVSLVWLAATAAVGAYGTASPDRIRLIREQKTAFADTRPRQDAFATLGTAVTDNRAEMRRRWADPDIRIEMAYSVAVFAPALAFFAVLALRRTRVDTARLMRWAAGSLVVAAVVGPLLLHIVAWDMHRWNALAALNAGLAALIVLMRNEPAVEVPGLAGGTSPALFATALIVTLWGVSSDPVFFDGYRPTHPPFSDQIEVLINGLRDWHADDWIPPIGN